MNRRLSQSRNIRYTAKIIYEQKFDALFHAGARQASAGRAARIDGLRDRVVADLQHSEGKNAQLSQPPRISPCLHTIGTEDLTRLVRGF